MLLKKNTLYLGIHSISDVNGLNCISYKTITDILQVLKANGWNVRDGILSNPNARYFTQIIFTSDDGRKLTKDFKSFFDENRLKCLFFACTSSKINGCPEELNFPLSYDDVEWLNSREHIIGSHTHDHKDLGKLRSNETFEYLQFSKVQIENLFRREIKYFSYPWGKRNITTIRALKKLGYKAAWIAAPGIPVKACKFTIPRLFIDSGKYDANAFIKQLNGEFSLAQNTKVTLRSSMSLFSNAD